MLRLLSILFLFSSTVFGQDLSRYGSVARQQTVLRNIQLQKDADQLRKIRNIRRELERTSRIRIVVPQRRPLLQPRRWRSPSRRLWQQPNFTIVNNRNTVIIPRNRRFRR